MGLKAGERTDMTRWQLAVRVAKNAIDMMHFADAARLIILNENSLGGDNSHYLVETSDENKALLKRSLDLAAPFGDKMTEAGFVSAFHTLRLAQQEEVKSTGCQKVPLTGSLEGHQQRSAL